MSGTDNGGDGRMPEAQPAERIRRPRNARPNGPTTLRALARVLVRLAAGDRDFHDVMAEYHDELEVLEEVARGPKG